MKRIVILGGGAAGIYTAVNAKALCPEASVIVLERSAKLLSKVRISGGGRCNVTHACFDPKELIKHYPRGSKELLGPFHQFQPRDTVQWFQERGVQLKTEADGRMFPVTDSSSTIIECLLNEAKQLGVEIRTAKKIKRLEYSNGFFFIESDEELSCDALVLATGSHSSGFEFAKHFGHSIVKPVPSLFTLNVPSSPLLDLSGTVAPDVELSLEGGNAKQRGPLLMTHWGFSGPCALKLSAWEARYFAERNYHVPLKIDWVPERNLEQVFETLTCARKKNPKHLISVRSLFDLPRKLWKRLLELSGMEEGLQYTNASNSFLRRLSEKLKSDPYSIEGKTTNKEEFVTCGGVNRLEVNFKTMESKLCPGLYFTGEILDIDGVTGGFNFQNAWTTARLAAMDLQSELNR